MEGAASREGRPTQGCVDTVNGMGQRLISARCAVCECSQGSNQVRRKEVNEGVGKQSNDRSCPSPGGGDRVTKVMCGGDDPNPNNAPHMNVAVPWVPRFAGL